MLFLGKPSRGTSRCDIAGVMDWVMELFKGLGAAAGLLSAGFLVWDRYRKQRPTALVVALPHAQAVDLVSSISRSAT